MASISKLSIRGVRSFSPDDEEQVIAFCFPVTMIVGANGCGKTTVIESLKYAVTGALPPGNRSGQTFVHDPKTVGRASVKAQIKLRFTNRAERSMVVVRSMEVTQRRSSMSFKALDGVLRTTHPETGERVSLSHKCTELDRQIPALIGVSRPVLEHVVFCHQEDSSWPLMEGAVLKKRFDDIFASTRYVKALEQIMKIKKEHASSAKDLKAELNGLASHKHAADETRGELETAQDKLDELHREVEAREVEIAERDAVLERHRALRAEAERRRGTLREAGARVEHQERLARSLEDMLEEDLTTDKSREELEEEVAGFDARVRDAEDEAERRAKECEAATAEVEALSERLLRATGRRAKLDAECEANKRTVEERTRVMRELSEKYEVPLPETDDDDDDVVASGTATQATASVPGDESVFSEKGAEVFAAALDERGDGLRRASRAAQRRHQERDDGLQTALAAARARLASLEERRAARTAEIRDARRALRELSDRASSAGASRVRRADVEEARERARRASEDLAALNAHPRLTAVPEEIRKHEEAAAIAQRGVDDDNFALTDLRRHASDRQAVTVLETQVERDTERLDEAAKELSFALSNHNVDAPRVDDLSTFDAAAEKVRERHEAAKRDLDRASRAAEEARTRTTEKRTDLRHAERSLKTVRDRLDVLGASNGGVARVLGAWNSARRTETDRHGSCRLPPCPENLDAIRELPEDFDLRTTLLKHLEDKADEYDTSKDDDAANVKRTVHKLFKLARTPNGVICPCCARDMDEERVEIFAKQVNKLDERILALDRSTSQQNRAAHKQYTNWSTMVRNGLHDWREFRRSTREADDARDAVRAAVPLVDSLADASAAADAEVDRVRDDVDALHALAADAARARDDARRVAERRRDVETRTQRLTVVAPSDGRTLAEVEADLARRLEEKETRGRAVAALNKEMATLNSRTALASRHAAEADREARDYEARHEKEREDAERRRTLQETVTRLAREEKETADEAAPLQREIADKERDKETARRRARAEETEAADEVAAFDDDARRLRALSDKIRTFAASDAEADARTARDEVVRVERSAATERDALVRKQSQLEALRKRVSEQERHRKSLQDNLRLLDCRDRKTKLERERDELRADIERTEARDSSSEQDLRDATRRRDELTAENARSEGRIAGLRDRQRELKAKLRTKEYKDVDERHRRKMIEHETALIVVDDLEKYHKALDKALLQYHGMKITDINKIIRELWTLTYKGEDISNIELVSGQDAGSRASRSYNYRVVMTKAGAGGTRLDMRGRCSAGQRVLASIVVRLALAETFCVNCGVMALDEPTTNLDHANKRGLATALAQIIAARSAQRNFQLVIITHDEDFVAMMKSELSTQTGFDMPEQYFQVSREEGRDGGHYSKINAIDWDNI